MNNMSLPRVSELMRPAERAKLVVSLELRGLEVGDDDTLPTENQIKQVVSGCPNSQVREYNFFISLKDWAWRMLATIELNQSFLETQDGRMMLVRHLLVISPTLNDCLRIVKGRQGDEVDREWDAVRFQLESLLKVEVSESVIRLTNPKFEEALRGFKQRFVERVEEIHKYAALIEKIEYKFFDGMEIVSRDPKHPTGVLPRVTTAIGKIVETHNRELREVVEGFNLLGTGSSNYKWEQIEEFLLEDERKVDSEWVERKLSEIEEEVRR